MLSLEECLALDLFVVSCWRPGGRVLQGCAGRVYWLWLRSSAE